MFLDEKIYQAYLEELQQLEKFRTANVALYGETPLESEDPNTKRLIESLAFFSARARLQGVKKITQIHQSLFRQYFTYLVNPLPTFALLQVKPSIRFPEKVVLPAGAELFLKTPNNLKATFQTLDPLTILPIFLKKFDFQKREGYGYRCIIEYGSPHISTEEIGSIKFFINHLNSFFSSIRLVFSMLRSLEKVQVFYDTSKIESQQGLNCSVRFGCNADERRVFNHEIEQIRSLLHFPQQELFVTFDLPSAGKRWQTFSLCLDFDEKWPDSLKITSDSFVPFIVPVANLKSSNADPIIYDGTKDSYPLLYPEPTYKFQLHTVTHVAEILSSGTKTLKPGILGKERETFEIDYFNQQILLDLPGAFNNPKTIAVQALWTQPWFAEYANDEFELQLNEAQVLGLGVKLLGSIHRYENTIEDDPNFLIRILSLKNQNYLNLNEILFIINSMKNLNTSFFDVIPGWIRDLTINQKMDQKSLSSVIEYEFFLKDWGGQKWEIVVLFFKYVNRLLNGWLPHFEIETKVHFPQTKKPLIIKKGKENELSVLARDFFLS